MVEGDGPAAGAKALLASRTNTLFSAPMVFGMLGGPHFAHSGLGYGQANLTTNALWISLALILVIELNGLFGKQGPITTVKGVITSSLVLTGIFGVILAVF